MNNSVNCADETVLKVISFYCQTLFRICHNAKSNISKMLADVPELSFTTTSTATEEEYTNYVSKKGDT